MGGQSTLARAALTRFENNDVHTLASRLTLETKMNQRADSWKENLAASVAKPLIAEHTGFCVTLFDKSAIPVCNQLPRRDRHPRKITDARSTPSARFKQFACDAAARIAT
jgi:hypothetical protein